MSLDTLINAWSSAFAADVQLVVARAIREIGPEQALANLQAAFPSLAPIKMLPAPKKQPALKSPEHEPIDTSKPYQGTHEARLAKISHLLANHPGLYAYQIRTALGIEAREWRAIAGHGSTSPILTIAYPEGAGTTAQWFLKPIASE